MTKETTYHRYRGIAKWVKVGYPTRDHGGIDMGDPNGSDPQVTNHERGGKHSVDLCVSDATKQKMIKDGIPEESLGYPQFKPDDEYDGYPWRYQFKVYRNTGWTDDDGNEVFLDPGVFNTKERYEDSDGNPRAKEWDWERLGEIGNGSEVQVDASVYKNGKRRVIKLLKMLVLEHKEYEVEEFVMY